MNTQKNNLKGSLILCLAALIWGLAFTAQSGAAKFLSAFTVNALRSFIAAAVLYLLSKFTDKGNKSFFPRDESRKIYYKAGLVCGVFLAVAVNFQQFGIAAYPDGAASEARAGFITALYVILVPIISRIFGKRISVFVWIGVIIAVTGVYMLCFSGGIGGLYLGDLLVFFCAICFSVHILAVDKYVGFTGGVKLSAMQFLVCGVISLILAVVFEAGDFTLSAAKEGLPYIVYLGIMSSGVAYTLQIVGQKYAEPAVASISMSLESVFAALGGWVMASNALSIREIIGCTLVFAAIITAQLGDFKKKPLNS